MARTQDEIVARFEARKESDPFGFETHEYLYALDLDHLKPFLKADAEPKDPADYPLETYRTPEAVRAMAVDYMPFAWEKANNRRGISANRSVMHLTAWFWLMGDDEGTALINDLFETVYEHYGKGILVAASEILGVDWRALDDGTWANDESSYENVRTDDAKAAWFTAIPADLRGRLARRCPGAFGS